LDVRILSLSLATIGTALTRLKAADKLDVSLSG